MEIKNTDRKRESLMDRDYPKIIKVILIFFIVSSTLNLLSQFFNNMILGDHTLAIIQFIGGGVSLVAFILIYKKNISGVYIYAFMMLLQVVFNMSSGANNLDTILISVIIRLAILSLIVFVPVRGFSVYNIMTYRKRHKSDIVNEKSLKEDLENYENAANINIFKSESVEVGAEEVEVERILEETIEENVRILPKEDNNRKDVIEAIQVGQIKIEKVEDEEEVDSDIDEPINKKNKIDNDKLQFIKRGLIALVAMLIIVSSVIVVKIAGDDYPEYVSSPLDKFKDYYSLANNKLFKDLLDKGEEALSNDLDVMGRKFMDAAFQVKTNNLNNILELATFYNIQREYKLAIDLYNKGVTIDKKNAELYYFIARNFRNLNIKEYDDVSYYKEDVVYNAQMALTLRPDYKEAILLLAECDIEYGEIGHQQKKWPQRYIEVAPEDSRGYFYLAKALYNEGNKEQARILYNKAIKIDPDNYLGLHYSYIGDVPFIIKSISVANSSGNGPKYIKDMVFDTKIFVDKAQSLTFMGKIDPLRTGLFNVDIKLFINGRLSIDDESYNGYTKNQFVKIDNLDDNSCYLGGFGYMLPGNFDAGEYRYEVWFGGEKLGSKSFKIYR